MAPVCILMQRIIGDVNTMSPIELKRMISTFVGICKIIALQK
jgi:hypothetical protein